MNRGDGISVEKSSNGNHWNITFPPHQNYVFKMLNDTGDSLGAYWSEWSEVGVEEAIKVWKQGPYKALSDRHDAGYPIP